ncbi:efflux RND transporter periplasmic adaptor subunit [Thalassobaculum sp.]|uniref:efflux RND transporter periplasmic adaptor subunit n=1 Tax=Thalassobaculum sp. TaxID=2022740 RepID=UPI0032F04DD1
MGTILTVIAITLGATALKLTSETTAEYFAMFVVNEDNLGASTQEPESLEPPAVEPARAGSASAMVARDDGNAAAHRETAPAPVPVLLAAAGRDDAVAAPAGVRLPSSSGERVVPASSTASTTVATETTATASAGPAAPVAAVAGEVSDPLLSLIGDTPFRRPDGTVFMPIAAQHVFGLRTVIGQRAAVPATVELPGRIVTNPSTAHLIQTAQDGFVQVARGAFPYAGQRVRRGEMLAYLQPSLTTVEQAQIDGQIQQLVNDIDLARKRMARLEEVLLIRYRANRIEQIRVEIEGMRRQLEVLRGSVERPIELRAQTDGVVSDVNAASGQFVHAGHTIFEIVDPTRLWVSASAFEPGLQDRIASASALTTDGRKLDLQFVGGGLTLRQQALPLHFEIVGSPADLSVDTPVTVVVQLEGPAATGLRVPRASVTRTSDGRELIWERRSAESFLSHHVAVTPIDADWVLVTSPIGNAVRVVTSGVATLGQVQ